MTQTKWTRYRDMFFLDWLPMIAVTVWVVSDYWHAAAVFAFIFLHQALARVRLDQELLDLRIRHIKQHLTVIGTANAARAINEQKEAD